MNNQPITPDSSLRTHHPSIIGRLVYLFEKWMPDPFILSILLTVVVTGLAFIIIPDLTISTLLNSWYNGFFKIFTFAFQMVLVLMTGYAVADSHPMRSLLYALARYARTPTRAVVLMFPLVALASWLNWGLGLVIAAFLSREIAHNARVDFAWLVAGAYSAWSICNNGLSSSIALSLATHGSDLNFIEQASGTILPLRETIFSLFVLIPSILVVVVMGIIFIVIHPSKGSIVTFSREDDAPKEPSVRKQTTSTPAQWMARSPVGTIILVLLGIGVIIFKCIANDFLLDINLTIFLFFMIGLVLQGNPLNYANSIRKGAHETGSMILQFPMYGGVMGIMSGTGLAATIAHGFITLANSYTLPILCYLSSLIITFMVPSAGGHWAIQGPFVAPATVALGASPAYTTMAVAMGENVSNMLQPFWAVPIVAMAGIRIQRVMGYTTLTFIVSAIIYGASLLVV